MPEPMRIGRVIIHIMCYWTRMVGLVANNFGYYEGFACDWRALSQMISRARTCNHCLLTPIQLLTCMILNYFRWHLHGVVLKAASTRITTFLVHQSISRQLEQNAKLINILELREWQNFRSTGAIFYHDVGEISDLSQSEAPNLVMWRVRVMQPTTSSPWRRGRSWPQFNVQENESMRCH